MTRKFKISYSLYSRMGEIVLDAGSKYDAKQRFYRLFPRAEILKVEEVEGGKHTLVVGI